MDVDISKNLQRISKHISSNPIFQELFGFSRKSGVKLYIAGGVVRDIILNREVKDIDFAVSSQCLKFSEGFSKRVKGRYVLLDEENKTSRVVVGGYNLDFTEFRGKDIEGDLLKRDFSINAMAIPFSAIMQGKSVRLLDPFSGLQDIKTRTIRAISEESIKDDPLRMVRAYRLAATYRFDLENNTKGYIKKHSGELTKVSKERIIIDLTRIFAVDKCYPWIEDMAKIGVFAHIFPEMEDMKDVVQDESHHLDVYNHSLLTLKYLEEVINQTQTYFKAHADSITAYVSSERTKILLKWAALFHDLGKPKVREINHKRKITFYRHERVGSETFLNMAQRLKLSKADTRFIQKMILLHMRPLHLMKPFEQGTLTAKGMRRFIRHAGGDLIGVFIVTMADSLAGRGPLKPVNAEARLERLFDAIYCYFKEKLEPVMMRPRLITGKDLIARFHLTPGPIFGTLLKEVEEAYIDGVVSSKEEAMEWLKSRIS